MEILKLIFNHWAEIIAGLSMILGGIYAICLIIPGEKPDIYIEKILNVTKKLSKK